MSKKITHERMKSIIDFNSEYYEETIDYIAQQERLDNELRNTMIIANSRLERLNGLELEFDKQEKLLELYKQLNIIYEKLYTMELSQLSLNSNYYEIEIIKLKQQIKELENEAL